MLQVIGVKLCQCKCISACRCTGSWFMAALLSRTRTLRGVLFPLYLAIETSRHARNGKRKSWLPLRCKWAGLKIFWYIFFSVCIFVSSISILSPLLEALLPKSFDNFHLSSFYPGICSSLQWKRRWHQNLGNHFSHIFPCKSWHKGQLKKVFAFILIERVL